MISNPIILCDTNCFYCLFNDSYSGAGVNSTKLNVSLVQSMMRNPESLFGKDAFLSYATYSIYEYVCAKRNISSVKNVRILFSYLSQAKIIFVSSSTLPLTFKEINEYAKMSDLKLGKIVQNRFLKRKIVLETHFLVDVLTDLAIYLLEYVIAFSNSLGLTEKERLDFGADIKPFLMGNTKNIEAHYHDALIQFYKQDAKQKDETVFQDCFLWLLEKLIAKCSHNNPKFHLFWGSFKGLAIRLKNPFKAIPFYVFDLSQFERNFDEVQVPIYRKKRYSEFGIKYLKSLLCGYFSGRSEFHKNDIMDFLWVSDFGAIDTATNYCVTFDKKMADILVNNLHLVVNPRCLLE